MSIQNPLDDPTAHWAFETYTLTPALVRPAVGIEGIDDILADLERGFAAGRPLRSSSATDPHAVASF